MTTKIYSIIIVVVALIAPQYALAADPDCSVDQVKLGDVLAGLQAGFVAGSRSKKSLAYGFDSSLDDGVATRGFVDPESEEDSFACENDYVIIGANVTSHIGVGGANRNPKEARDSVDSGLGGFIVGLRFELDGIPVDHIRTATKIGNSPYCSDGDGRSGCNDKTRAAFYAAGAIIEPYTLSPGNHTATVIFRLDLGGGEFDFPLLVNFMVHGVE